MRSMGIKLAVLAAAMVFSQGCATAIVRLQWSPCPSAFEGLPPVYPASCWDTDFILASLDPTMGGFPLDLHWRLLTFCGGAVDLPVSLVLDTLLLPWDLYWR